MREILEGLKAKQIMKNEDILILREYIGKKYPEAGLKERSAILADAVHRVIDGHIQEFDEKHRARIRGSLMQKAVSENHFAITAENVFRACLVLQNNEEEYSKAFTEWVNRQQATTVSREALQRFSNKVRQVAGDLLDHDWGPVLDRLEELKGAPLSKKVEAKPVIAGPSNIFPNTIKTASEAVDRFDRIQGTFSVFKKQIAVFRQTILNQRIPGVGGRRLPQVLIASLVVLSLFMFQPLQNILSASFGSTMSNARSKEPVEYAGTILPEDLTYKAIDIMKLRYSLKNRNSILADEPYLSEIIKAAKEFDVNPLFLFAITGQEQAFVPRTDKDARKIANNPFNVYHSWSEYNTNIQDSARIAARTVTNLSRNRPDAVDPVVWINLKYAEDKKWWIGVSRIFGELKKEVEERE